MARKKASPTPARKPKTLPPPPKPRTRTLSKHLVLQLILAKLATSTTCDWHALSLRLAPPDTGKTGKGKAAKGRGAKGRDGLSGSELHELYHNFVLPGLKSGRALWDEGEEVEVEEGLEEEGAVVGEGGDDEDGDDEDGDDEDGDDEDGNDEDGDDDDFKADRDDQGEGEGSDEDLEEAREESGGSDHEPEECDGSENGANDTDDTDEESRRPMRGSTFALEESVGSPEKVCSSPESSPTAQVAGNKRKEASDDEYERHPTKRTPVRKYSRKKSPQTLRSATEDESANTRPTFKRGRSKDDESDSAPNKSSAPNGSDDGLEAPPARPARARTRTLLPNSKMPSSATASNRSSETERDPFDDAGSVQFVSEGKKPTKRARFRIDPFGFDGSSSPDGSPKRATKPAPTAKAALKPTLKVASAAKAMPPPAVPPTPKSMPPPKAASQRMPMSARDPAPESPTPRAKPLAKANAPRPRRKMQTKDESACAGTSVPKGKRSYWA